MSDRTEWNIGQLMDEFHVRGFAAGFVIVERKADGVVGSMRFHGSPRLYFDFKADEGWSA